MVSKNPDTHGVLLRFEKTIFYVLNYRTVKTYSDIIKIVGPIQEAMYKRKYTVSPKEENGLKIVKLAIKNWGGAAS